MKKILLVESDVDLGSTVKEYLSGLGYEVEHVHRPCSVTSSIRMFSPDIVLTDLLSSGAEGRNLPRMVRAGCGQGCAFKLVLFSSADEAVQREMLESGVVDVCLDRELTLDMLGEAISSLSA